MPARAERICRPARGSSTRCQAMSASAGMAITVSAWGSKAAAAAPWLVIVVPSTLSR